MDKQTISGFVLIALILILWMYWNTPVQRRSSDFTSQDSTTQRIPTKDKIPPKELMSSTRQGDHVTHTRKDINLFGKWFSDLSAGNEQTYEVSTSLYKVRLSTFGGGINRYTLKKYSTWNNQPLQLIDWSLNSDFNLLFATSDGKLVDTRNLFFHLRNEIKDPIVELDDSATFQLQFMLPVVKDSSYILKTFIFRGGRYNIECEVVVVNMSEVIANYEYQISINSLALTERNSIDEASNSHGFAYVNSELQQIDATSVDESVEQNYLGQTKWISTRNKYFMNALIDENDQLGFGAFLEGRKISLPDKGERKIYSASLKIKYLGNESESKKFLLYIGPIEYNLLKDIHPGLEKTLNLGWAWIVRPISEYIMLPLLKFLHHFIPNYGFVIILFSVIIKVTLLPLTKSSMDSMRKMQSLQPMMNEMREKYKDDPQRLNVDMMKLYKEYGINPLGGCLPLLLQMPILYALFTIFGSTIELRQATFFGWISDLSIPDSIIDLPFQFPLFGFSHVSGLSLFMGITMFFQQKQSVKDPRQKSMIYLMPILFTLMFNSFPSGLNLYYLVFNLLSIGQQYYLNKKFKNIPLQKVKKKETKKSWVERSFETLQKKTVLKK